MNRQEIKDFIQSKGYVPNTLLSYDAVVELMVDFATSLTHTEGGGKERQIIRKFMFYFDGVAHLVEPEVNISTYQMGLCDLKLTDKGLKVTLRRPGLLIGKGGETINRLKDFLECDILIEEKKF